MNGVVRYSLSDNYFRVDSADGTVSVAHQLDYERRERHQLTVTATDAGVPTLSSLVTVIIQGERTPIQASCPPLKKCYTYGLAKQKRIIGSACF